MKKEYDFTNSERGKFYNKEAKMNLPVYLEEENYKFVEKIAEEKNLDLTTIVNRLIKENINIAQVLN